MKYQSNKKNYCAPSLTVHGTVKELTQNVFKIGHGDTFGNNIVINQLASK